MSTQTSFGAGGVSDLVVGIRVDTSQANADLTNLITKYEIVERTMIQAMQTSARLTGDENMKRGTQVIIRFTSAVTQAQLAASLLMATNPWLWPLGVLGMVNVALSVPDLMAGY